MFLSVWVKDPSFPDIKSGDVSFKNSYDTTQLNPAQTPIPNLPAINKISIL